MSRNRYVQSGLFMQDYLMDAIRSEVEYTSVDTDSLVESLSAIFSRFPVESSPNEAQTEDDLIWPVLELLGWTSFLRQQSLAIRGRVNVPDGLLFLDDSRKTLANSYDEEWKRYECGTALVEAKRWKRPLDRRSALRNERTTPSTQMLRYLRQIDDLTNGALRWGILTNGAVWRLYYQGARSVSENFLQVDLHSIISSLMSSPSGSAADTDHCLHCVRIFAAMFCRNSFFPSTVDSRTFQQRSIDKGMYFEERVRKDLSEKVFGDVYPILLNGMHSAAPDEDLPSIRNSALILLYRMLFVFYAEDRDLLPVDESRYEQYGLRSKLRLEIGRLLDEGHAFSSTLPKYWNYTMTLFTAINDGDNSIGLPPYNGRLFDPDSTPLLLNISLPDSVMAQVVDSLSFEKFNGIRRYINYRDLSVQHLGSIYEKLLEFEPRHDDEGGLAVHLNAHARKSTGSYYTPDELVELVIHETISPLIDDCIAPFRSEVLKLGKSSLDINIKLDLLQAMDPAERILELKVCDPSMGSGHFLVHLVDYLSNRVIEAIGEGELLWDWSDEIDYTSPITSRISAIRSTIVANAWRYGWTIDVGQLSDLHIVKRMILKRCIYGVDKNDMAVELAKVSLWLHTFTVGAPLSFLDHHLRCGNSLFGADIRRTLDRMDSEGSAMLIHETLLDARDSAKSMQSIERLTDAEIAEAHRSMQIFGGIVTTTRPLKCFLSLFHAIEWMDVKGDARASVDMWLDGLFGDPLRIAMGRIEPTAPDTISNLRYSRKYGGDSDDFSGVDARAAELCELFSEVLEEGSRLVDEEKFFNWYISFPGLWKDWETSPEGGFDAIIGNPPWDRVKLQQAWWFISRYPDIDKGITAAERAHLVSKLSNDHPYAAIDYEVALSRARATSRMARFCGDYPQLSAGDVNLQSLFIERGLSLVRKGGMLGYLVPTGIATDKTTSKFFRSIASSGNLKCLHDFENHKKLFSAVHSQFKFCAFVVGKDRFFETTACSFFSHSVDDVFDGEKAFSLTAGDFLRMNPNTGTMPIFRTKRDADLTMDIYERLPVLGEHSPNGTVFSFSVKYHRMFDVANDSDKFHSSEQLKFMEKAWPGKGSMWESKKGKWLPLYTGRMFHQYDHRFASAATKSSNPYRTTQSIETSQTDKSNPNMFVTPQFWVSENDIRLDLSTPWLLAFRNITSATNMRTMIATAIPCTAVGHSAPLLLPFDDSVNHSDLALLLANLNSIVFDFVARQKVQSNNFTWYTLEQMPVVPIVNYASSFFGSKSARELVLESVLELCYTANDLSGLAASLGFVGKNGRVRSPFGWNAERRLQLRAKLDAVYFHLYGVYNGDNVQKSHDDISYIYSTFPIVERNEIALYGAYRTRELALAYCNALESGVVEIDVNL